MTAGPPQVFASEGTTVHPPQLISALIQPINRSKYPAVSAEEQACSVPLQILCLAILDVLLLHIVSSVAPDAWQPVRRSLCEALIHGKLERTCRVIATYSEIDVFFIQARFPPISGVEGNHRVLLCVWWVRPYLPEICADKSDEDPLFSCYVGSGRRLPLHLRGNMRRDQC